MDYQDGDTRESREAFKRTMTGGSKPIQLDQIVSSLKDMQRNQFTKETEWLFEKSQMTQ